VKRAKPSPAVPPQSVESISGPICHTPLQTSGLKGEEACVLPVRVINITKTRLIPINTLPKINIFLYMASPSLLYCSYETWIYEGNTVLKKISILSGHLLPEWSYFKK
jgi:hypothetical protein